jgi:hypothetical protein
MKLISAVPWLADTEVGLELLGLDEQQIARAMSEKRRVSVTQMLQRMPAQAPVQPVQPEPAVTDAGIGG